MLYTVTLTYDVTVSKVVTVSARSPEEAKVRAVDRAVRGEAGPDHYDYCVDSPSGIDVESKEQS